MANQAGDHKKAVSNREAMVALAVFDVLGKTLSAAELRRYGWQTELNLSDIRESASQYRIVADGQIRYGLRSQNLSSVVSQDQLTREYWRWVSKNRWLLTLVPYVRMVAVMNSLAHGNVHGGSDIDLLVVTSKRRLWTARGWMLVLLKVFGRRAWGELRAKKFSPEFFVDEDHMDLSGLASSSTYLRSVWVADMTPILYGWNFEKFWQANQWLNNYLPVAYRSPRSYEQNESRELAKSGLANLVERLLAGKLGDRIEAWARLKQERIIKRSTTRLGDNPTVAATDYVCKAYFRDQKPDLVEAAVREFLA